MTRVIVNLQVSERDALRTLAKRERRELRDQAAVIIRCELERAGLLPADTPTPIVVQPAQGVSHASGN